MSWREVYRTRRVSAAQAIHLIRAGERILIGSGAAEPLALVEALCANGEHLSGNEIVHLLTLGPAPYVEPRFAQRFRHKAFFIGANVRAAVQAGRADFVPVFLSEIPELLRSRLPVDAALIQVSPPDVRGFVSLGVSVDIVRAAVDSARLVIAEVNPRMPNTRGDTALHVTQLSAIVEVERPLLVCAREPLGPVETQIASHVASLIDNGSTLQLGIGKIPDAVLQALGDHKDLGVHTEMFSDGVMQLAEAGVINGAKKTLLPKKIVTSFVIGSEDLYAWCNDHPMIELRGSDFVNDPQVIARNQRMVAVNSALAVDLSGQVASDSVQGKFFSGIGGQVDFVRGAARSREGKAVIALPSTARDGTVSRIQAVFEPGTGVVTSRGDVRYVVTEYGIADLWGRSVRERSLALMQIAHPDFRESLLLAAREHHYLT